MSQKYVVRSRDWPMKKADGLRREIEALRDRLPRLNEAGLRITEDLDLDTVLQGSWTEPVP